MKNSPMSWCFVCGFFVMALVFAAAQPALADEEEDLAAMQRALNKEILERPFDPGDQAEVDRFVEEALKKNQIPQEYTGKDWKRGYTCNNLTYSLSRYRNCLHYYRYYGGITRTKSVIDNSFLLLPPCSVVLCKAGVPSSFKLLILFLPFHDGSFLYLDSF